VRRDAALKEGVELGSLMNCGSSQPVLASVCAMKLTACCCARAVQGGVLGAVALVVERCIRRPLGLPADSLHDGAPRGGEPARSQAVLRASFALSAACRRVPSAAGLLQVPVRRSSRQLSGAEIRTADVSCGPGSPIRDLRKLSFAHDVVLIVRCHAC